MFITTPDLILTPRWQLSLQTLLTFILSLTVTVAQNPINNYAPTVRVNCPETTAGPLVRTFTLQIQVLNTLEAEYIASRESSIISNAWSNWLGNVSDIGCNFPNLQSKFPRIGIAIGGQRYQTAQYAAGVSSGLDWRNDTARVGNWGSLASRVLPRSL